MSPGTKIGYLVGGVVSLLVITFAWILIVEVRSSFSYKECFDFVLEGSAVDSQVIDGRCWVRSGFGFWFEVYK